MLHGTLYVRHNCHNSHGIRNMAVKTVKKITVMLFKQQHIRTDWFFDFSSSAFQCFCTTLARELRTLGIALEIVQNHELVIQVNSYADLLNAIKISSPEDGQYNLCVGHIIGISPALSILDDISAAVRRMAFAPETITPSSEYRKVCHNCGCGC